jgi:hypothetical protein
MSFLIGLVASSKRGFKAFTDLFTRSNGSLGSPWKNIRGTWSISSNTTTSSDSASSYPIATIDISGPESQTLVADVSSGTGIAFWVSDSGNWWGVYRKESNFTTFYDCSYSNYVYQWCYTMYCSSCGSCEEGPFYAEYCYLAEPNCNEYCYDICVGYQYYQNYPCPIYAFTDCSYTEFVSQTCSTSGTNKFLTLIRSISNTVSSIVNHSVSSTISTIKLIISSNNVNAIAYSDTSMNNNIGSFNQSIDTVKPRSGIIIVPSDNQGNTLTKFKLN